MNDVKHCGDGLVVYFSAPNNCQITPIFHIFSVFAGDVLKTVHGATRAKREMIWTFSLYFQLPHHFQFSLLYIGPCLLLVAPVVKVGVGAPVRKLTGCEFNGDCGANL